VVSKFTASRQILKPQNNKTMEIKSTNARGEKMRYTLKNKLFSIGGDSIVQDDRGRDVFIVDGAAISIGRRLVIKDMKGNELATIQQTLIALTPTFEIRRKDGPTAKISMKLLSLTDRLKIDLPGNDDLEARGDIFHLEYSISRRGRKVAQVSKRWISLKDSYGIEISDDQDDVLIIACAVVIDAILDMKERGDRE
jgi:uncharacterized protein YxjI